MATLQRRRTGVNFFRAWRRSTSIDTGSDSACHVHLTAANAGVLSCPLTVFEAPCFVEVNAAGGGVWRGIEEEAKLPPSSPWRARQRRVQVRSDHI